MFRHHIFEMVSGLPGYFLMLLVGTYAMLWAPRIDFMFPNWRPAHSAMSFFSVLGGVDGAVIAAATLYTFGGSFASPPALIIICSVGAMVGSTAFYWLFKACTWLRIRYLMRPPRCKNGACQIPLVDYLPLAGSVYGWLGPGVYHFRCGCGDQYVWLIRQFKPLMPDFTTPRYKVLRGFSKWVDDHTRREGYFRIQ